MTPRVREILEWYSSENPGLLTNLARILNSGDLAGSGRLCIFAVTEELLSNPAEKFSSNPNSFDPNYHFELAVESGVSAYIGSLGAIQACARNFAGEIPMILNLNSFKNEKSVLLATTADALRLGCSAVALTIKHGSEMSAENLTQIQRILASAQQVGLPLVVNIKCSSSMDEVASCVQASVQMGAHITMVSAPEEHFTNSELKKSYHDKRIRTAKLYDRVKHTLDCSLGGKRIVLFEAGSELGSEELTNQAKEIARGGGFGSMVGLMALKKSKDDSVKLLSQLMSNFKVK